MTVRYPAMLERHQLVRLAYAVSRRSGSSNGAYWSDVNWHCLSGERRGARTSRTRARGLQASPRRLRPPEILYWHAAAGEEVDFAVESRGRLRPWR
jgi:hypothetical protein